ncbi:hypothetical protein KA012_01640 [Candidatus Woesebacteria bacterium]|nr:hypothetical protein [Candidatus Woesebacteria bacterium]
MYAARLALAGIVLLPTNYASTAEDKARIVGKLGFIVVDGWKLRDKPTPDADQPDP